MDILVRAARVRAILDDDVFDGLINQVKQDQINVFLDPAATLDKVAEARLQVRAIEDLIGRMNDVLTEAKIFERKTKKRN